jgi:hypothetical protein
LGRFATSLCFTMPLGTRVNFGAGTVGEVWHSRSLTVTERPDEASYSWSSKHLPRFSWSQ